MIHLGDQAAVVVPVTDFLRLRALQEAATPEDLEDAEDTAAVLEWKARDAAGQTTFVPASEAEAPAGHAPVSLRVDYDERAISRAAGFLDDRRASVQCWTRSTDWPTILGRPCCSRMGRQTFGGYGSAGTGCFMRSPKMRSRSGTSLAARRADTAGRSSRRLVPGCSGGIKRYER